MKRISSGIKGLDDLIGGGIPEKDLVLLSGVSGAGKTVFGLQFLMSAAKTEPGIFVSFEQDISQLRIISEHFGWPVEKLEKENKFRLLRYDPFRLEDILEVIENNIREINAKRIVIDSISSLGIYINDAGELRRMILLISNLMRKNSCTSLLISEVTGDGLSRFGVEEYLTDGVIHLSNKFVDGEYRRALTVWKMRLTNHSRKVHSYEITDSGISVSSKAYKS